MRLLIALLTVTSVLLMTAGVTETSRATEEPEPPTSAGTAPDGPEKGDVNCDDIVNAVDATLILQKSGGLVAELPCDERADINDDGAASAVDAALILQLVAGRIGGVPESTAEVDPSVSPLVDSIPDPRGGPPRPVTSLTDDDDNRTDFVANELMVFADSQAELDGLLSRWNGEVIDSPEMDPAMAAGTSVAGMSMQSAHLVRIDPSSAAEDGLTEDLHALDDTVASNLRFAGETALRLIAVSASEALRGVTAVPNPVVYGNEFSGGSTVEASSGPMQGGIPYTANAFEWPYMNQGSAQDIGVGAAWRALKIANRLSNWSDVLIFDGGFAPNPDFPDGYRALGSIFKENPAQCGGNPCPWHGTDVVSTGFGVADNNMGVAGPGGPVSDLTVVGSPASDLWEIVTYIVNLPRVFGDYPEIINVSAGVRLPAAVCAIACQPLHVFTQLIKNVGGTLFFAAAGNDGRDVEKLTCAPPFDWPCWESGQWIPCELAEVLCVGGMAWDSNAKAGGSNWSSNASDNNTVDIYGPYVVYTGPTPDNNGNVPQNGAAQITQGTSFSSPFVAGVAALIWAADPSMSAHQVANILMSTAHTNGTDSRVTRWVNAFGAVAQALGSQPPSLEILRPDPDNPDLSAPAGFPVEFWGRALDVEDGSLEITWTSDVDGLLGTSEYPLSLSRDDLTIGTHTITAMATDSDGLSVSRSFDLEIKNDPPEMEITTPDDGDKFVEGEQILFRSSSSDDLGVELDDDQVEWFSDIDGSLGEGHDILAFLSEGVHEISVAGTDQFGETGSDSIVITVNPPPPDLPPTVQITFPEHGDFINPNFETDLVKITLEGSATDPEDGPLTGASLVWTVRTNDGPVQTLGTGESLYVELPNPPGCGNFWSQEITLTATDSGGNIRSDTVVINDGFIVC